MGRSVETIGNNVIYFSVQEDNFDADDYLFGWNGLMECIGHALQERYKSLYAVERWVQYPYRETRVFCENRLACFSISVYCGLGAISVYTNPDATMPCQVSENWVNNVMVVVEEIVGKYAEPLRPIAHASNGELFLEKK